MRFSEIKPPVDWKMGYFPVNKIIYLVGNIISPVKTQFICQFIYYSKSIPAKTIRSICISSEYFLYRNLLIKIHGLPIWNGNLQLGIFRSELVPKSDWKYQVIGRIKRLNINRFINWFSALFWKALNIVLSKTK